LTRVISLKRSASHDPRAEIIQEEQMFNTSIVHENPARRVPPPQAPGTLLEKFHADFVVLTTGTPEHIREALRIRHQVYCVENSFETEADGRQGIETDEYDSHAAHALLLCRNTGTTLGTVRLVLPLPHAPERSFPLQRLLDPASASQLNALPLASTAEISRLSISRHSRRLMRTGPAGGTQAALAPAPSGPLMRLGLMQGLVEMGRTHGLTHCCALMEPTLLRMLDAMAMRFHPIGQLVEFHGLRQPCYIHIPEMLDEVMHERPSFWEVLTGGGALAPTSPVLRAIN
jgi:N-acyl amino acid synthase of PEP-CTERM/exosortase system